MILEALEDILKEMRRQVRMYGVQHLPPGTGGPMAGHDLDRAREVFSLAHNNGLLTWRDVLEEEIHEVYNETDPHKIREELIQCAAVICSWIRDIDTTGE